MLTDDLPLLRALDEAPQWNRAVGATAHNVADHLERDVGDVLGDLQRLEREGLVEGEVEPVTRSRWYSVTERGDAALVEAGGPPTGEALL